jgi:hypothetical protein
MIRHEREIVRLNRVMEREGPEFSEREYETYKSRVNGGIMLLVLGVGSLATGAVYCLYHLIHAIGEAFDGTDDPEGDEYDSGSGSNPGSDAVPSSSSHDEDAGPEFHPAVPGVLFPLGGVLIASGIPLLITGVSGKHRQELLRRKDEILAPFDPYAVTASVSLFADSQGNVGGLRAKVTF